MRAAWSVMAVLVLAACPGEIVTPDGGSGGGSAGGVAGGGEAGGSAGGGVATGGGAASTGGGEGGGTGGTGGGSAVGGGTATGGGSAVGGGSATGGGNGVGGGANGTGGGMMGTGGGSSGPVSVSITFPMGTVYTRDLVTLALNVTGNPDTVVINVDGMQFLQVMAPFSSATLDTTTLPEGPHVVVARATRGAAWDESVQLMVVADRTAPSIAKRWPNGDGWLGEVYGVEFSEPVLSASVGPMALTANLASLAPRLSGDRRQLVAKATGTPPSLPFSFEVTVGMGITDLAGNPLPAATWATTLKRWDTVSTGASGVSPRIAIDSSGWNYVVATEGSAIHVRRLTPGKIESLGSTMSGSAPDIAVDAMARAVIAYVDGSSVVVKRFEAGAWVTLGSGLSGSAPDLLLDATGAPFVAYVDAGAVRVAKWDGTSWGPAAAPLTTTGSLAALVLTDMGVPTLAYVENGQLKVATADGMNGWTQLGNNLNVSFRDAVTAVSITRTPTAIVVAWEENQNIQVSQWNGTAWARVLRPADVDLVRPARWPSIATSASGTPFLAWTEVTHWGKYMTQCSWLTTGFVGPEWKPCGGEPAAYGSRLGAPSLAMHGNIPVVAVNGSTSLEVHRWNGSAVPNSFGMEERGLESACDVTGRPGTLSATNCFDLTTNPPTAAPDLIPFDLVSPLWSDGALKRRWLRLPPGETVDYQNPGPWGYPVGTMLVKEFSYEQDPADPTTRKPTETRFLVKQEDGGWEGSSYQWNDQFTDATLMNNTTTSERKFFPYLNQSDPDAGYTQIYPGNAECQQCHRAASGFILGLQGGQLNRSFDYGNGVSSNQVTTLQHLGVLGSAPIGAAGRFVNVHDTTESLTRRVRGYLAANCAHCHRPGGLRPTRDFRWETQMPATNICNPNAPLGAEVNPGDAGTSLMYLRMSTRGVHGAPYGQMPPVATDHADTEALQVVEAWINNMTVCQ